MLHWDAKPTRQPARLSSVATVTTNIGLSRCDTRQSYSNSSWPLNTFMFRACPPTADSTPGLGSARGPAAFEPSLRRALVSPRPSYCDSYGHSVEGSDPPGRHYASLLWQANTQPRHAIPHVCRPDARVELSDTECGGFVSTVDEAIEVRVPVRTAYNQWTQFEEFPKFMDGVESIRQITDTRTHWVTKVAGVTREFDAAITEQHPDERIAWCSIEGPKQAGVVTFHRLDPGTTRIMLQLEIDPEGFTEQVGDKLGLIKARAKGDLRRFKEFIESQGAESGAWRGDIHQDSAS